MFFDRIIIASLPLWTKLFNILIKIMNWKVYHLLQRMALHMMKPLPEIWCSASEIYAGFNVASVRKSCRQTLGCQYKMSMIFPLRYIKECSRLAAFVCISHPAGGAFWFPVASWRTWPWAGAEESHPPQRSGGPGHLHVVTYTAAGVQPPRVPMTLSLLPPFFFSTSTSVFEAGSVSSSNQDSRYRNGAVMVPDKANAEFLWLQASSEDGLWQPPGTSVRRVPGFILNRDLWLTISSLPRSLPKQTCKVTEQLKKKTQNPPNLLPVCNWPWKHR